MPSVLPALKPADRWDISENKQWKLVERQPKVGQPKSLSSRLFHYPLLGPTLLLDELRLELRPGNPFGDKLAERAGLAGRLCSDGRGSTVERGFISDAK